PGGARAAGRAGRSGGSRGARRAGGAEVAGAGEEHLHGVAVGERPGRIDVRDGAAVPRAVVRETAGDVDDEDVVVSAILDDGDGRTRGRGRRIVPGLDERRDPVAVAVGL